MARRTFGWVQNPGKLSNLKKVVSVFKLNSKYNIWLREVRLPLLKNIILFVMKIMKISREYLQRRILLLNTHH